MRWLVAYDGSAGSQLALRRALEFAPQLAAEVSLLSVAQPLPAYAVQEEQSEETAADLAAQFFSLVQDEARQEAARAGVSLAAFTLSGPVADTIAGFARDGRYHLVLLGASGELAQRQRLGSVADRVGQIANCSVLIVR